jgi:hypothetical protein
VIKAIELGTPNGTNTGQTWPWIFVLIDSNIQQPPGPAAEQGVTLLLQVLPEQLSVQFNVQFSVQFSLYTATSKTTHHLTHLP